MAAAGDVPRKYDCLVAGEGYMFADTQDIKAEFGYTPTFVQRTNIEGDYGDDKQAFWLTFSQRDWSLGEGQKFYRQDATSSRRFYSATAADIRVPGQVTMRQAVTSVSVAAAVNVLTPLSQFAIHAANTTKLYEIDYLGVVTDRGAHGLGAAPTGIANDSGGNTFLASDLAGSVGVRRYASAAFTTFSGSGATEIEYLNNTLFGMEATSGLVNTLIRYDSGGTASVIYSWFGATAGPRVTTLTKLRAYGGKLLIMLNVHTGTELWQYDGQGVSLLTKLPANFYGSRIEVLHGLAFVGGVFVKAEAGGGRAEIPGIYFYKDGQIGLLWRSDVSISAAGGSTSESTSPAMCTFDSGLVFTDDARGRFMFYDIVNGGVHAIGSYTVAGSQPQLAATQLSFLHSRNQTTAYLYPDAASIATSTTIISSLVDFDSSLAKHFKAGKIEATIPAGASIDLAYQVDALDGSWTTFQTGAVSGTEYSIGANGRAIALRVTLNKGSSAAGPTLTRAYVRAIPINPRYRRETYLLNCGGRDGKQQVLLRDGTPHPKDGLAMATDLRTAMASTTPISVTDEFGTFNGVILSEESTFRRIRPEEYLVQLTIREV